MTVFLFDVLLSFLIFLRLISVFGFQGTTLTVFISHSSVLLRLRISESKLSYALLREKRLNGDGEIRTLDPLLARQVLSQLSYAPIWVTYLIIQSHSASGLEKTRTSDLTLIRRAL